MEKIIIRWGNSASFVQFVLMCVQIISSALKVLGCGGRHGAQRWFCSLCPTQADFDFCDLIPQDGSDWNPLPVSFKHKTRQVADNFRSCAKIALKKLVLVCDTHGPCSVCETEGLSQQFKTKTMTFLFIIYYSFCIFTCLPN